MKKILKVTALAVLASALLASCASDNSGGEKKAKAKKGKFDQVVYAEAIAKGNYAVAAEQIVFKNNKAHDKIDLLLTESMLNHLGKNIDASTELLGSANLLMEQKGAELNAGQVMVAGTTSEYNVAYSGTAYEYGLVDIMAAVNLLKSGDVDNARAMTSRFKDSHISTIQKILDVQAEVNAKSEEKANEGSDDDAKKESAVNVKDVMNQAASFKPAQYDSQYKLSPFCSYLGTVLAAVEGSEAMESVNEWKDTYLNSSVLANTDGSVELKDDKIAIDDVTSVLGTSEGRLEVVALTDLISTRTSTENQLPVLDIMLKLNYPSYKASEEKVREVSVTIDGVETKSVELIENFSAAVKDDVLSKARSGFNRSLSRNITQRVVPYISALVTKEVAVAKGNAMVATTAQIAFAAAVAGINKISDHADERQGEFFPAKASAAGFTLAPNTYKGIVKYTMNDGTTFEDPFEATVEAGKAAVVVSECMNYIPVVIDEK